MVTGRLVAPHKPTFYLGGQPYELDMNELLRSPDLIPVAIEETRRQFWRYFGHRVAGLPLAEETECLSEEETVKRMTEMLVAVVELDKVVPPHLRRKLLLTHFTANLN